MIRALIFDFDGLIFDTEYPEYLSWQEIFTAHGCSVPLDTWCAAIGVAWGSYNPYTELEKQVQQPLDHTALRAAWRRRFLDLLAAQDALPGIREYISEARECGLLLAVASSSSRRWVTSNLGRLGLQDAFNVIATCDDVAQTKPAPDLYLTALERLGVCADEALAFEDSPTGSKAAKAAGLFTVVVPNPLTRSLPFPHADLQVESLAHLPLQRLLRLQGNPAVSG